MASWLSMALPNVPVGHHSSLCSRWALSVSLLDSCEGITAGPFPRELPFATWEHLVLEVAPPLLSGIR